jgi:alpha-tubulin suppressor-like RCC1 family protein
MTRRHRVSLDLTPLGTEEPATDAAQLLLQTVLYMLQKRDASLRNLGLLNGLAQRCRDLDAANHSTASLERALCLNQHAQNDSGYTLLHDAIYQGDICRILYLLRGPSDRFTRRPMEVLYSNSVLALPSSSHHAAFTSSCAALRDMVTYEDQEGLAPAGLLSRLQRQELATCRRYLEAITLVPPVSSDGRRSRSNSLFEELSHDDAVEDEQNEFATLSRALRRRSQRRNPNDDDCLAFHENNNTAATTYGCEVVTFGRAHHCALGVVASHRHEESGGGDVDTKRRSLFRPQRVAAFAQDSVGRRGTAVAIASATFHTLTLTADGALYAFGLGKGGRLGTGDEKPCATPMRVLGPLAKQRVTGIAAAENHSLCVTAQGYVYAFGSNRFGQLGISTQSTTTSKDSSEDSSYSRCVPRRVDDLKQVPCVSVAAGTKHSVALTRKGEVYVWGDNSAGQLGINMHSVGSGIHKVQRVEALWKATPNAKIAVAIAASDQSTLVLISGSGQRGLAVNSVYSWGNGNHIPCKAQFGQKSSSQIINPVAISCAKYHNVAITSSGHVYSWGLHADVLGTGSSANRRNRSSSNGDKSTSLGITALSAPQLVTGMLPENGGGRVVGISTSENHTAAITDDGHLWTWGDTYKQNVLGHEGVRWQPEPKRVPGVHRAVAVSAAKEHTVLLIGTSFPPLPSSDDTMVPSLETLSARSIAQHCDLFNIFPVLTIAERTQTRSLLQYCKNFVRLNLDGVLNVSQKSAMDNYLNEQLFGSSLEIPRKDYCDDEVHPFILNVILAGSERRESFGKDRLCSVENWLNSCTFLSRQRRTSSIVKRFKNLETEGPSISRPRGSSISEYDADSNRPIVVKVRKNSISSERYDEITSDMDLSTKFLAEAKLVSLNKEVRAIRKRLSQISKLEKSQELSNDEKQKVSRRALLESALLKFDPAIETVEAKIRSFVESKSNEQKDQEMSKASLENNKVEKAEVVPVCPENMSKTILRCKVCEITCPDSKSYELHMNGRRHRNRMSQVAADETQEVAASMVEEQHRLVLLQPTANLPSRVDKQVARCAWGQTTSPKYTLPPPPHPVVDEVNPSSPSPKMTLEAIMAEEEHKARTNATSAAPGRGFVLQLPKGCPATLKSPPWEAARKATNTALLVPSPPQKSSIRLKSPDTPIASAETSATPRSVYSLGDFLTQPKPVTVTVPSPTVAWTTPSKAVKFPSVSLREIQSEEQDFKTKQDVTFGATTNNKWFIEKRERAGSLKDIQSDTVQEEASRMLVEEQRRIEQQIYDEIAARNAAEAKLRKGCQTPGKKKRHNGKGSSPKIASKNATTVL